jgi:uncharacterized delta-60 repeat protein
MLGEVKKLKSLVIMTSCVLLTGAIFPGNLFAETVIEEWVATYNGPANGYDFAIAMAMDSSGNVYVTGQSWGGTATHYGYLTVKYDPFGNELWTARYDGPGNGRDDPSAIAVDPSGNVYVTGFCNIGSVDFDYATVKYNSSGVEQWVARYDGPAHMHDYAYAMDVDASGNVYVTGRSKSSESNFDYATVKYDTNGNQLWVARYDFSGYAEDEACAITVDSAGKVYVTGLSWNTGTNHDYATVKYDTNGNQLWVARYDGQANASDEPEAIALDSEGNVYVTGGSYGTGNDYATVKYNPSGVEQWVARYNGPGNGYDLAAAMALDMSGNVYVTGRSCGSGTGDDYATVKYDPIGNKLWVARYNGPGNNQDYPEAMVLDASDNIYVTGWSYGDSSALYDTATVKYDSSGNQLWIARYNGNGPAGTSDYSSAIAVDTSDNIYVTGQSDSSDYLTIKYAQYKDPAKAIEALIAAVISLNLQQGISNSLDAKLGAALNALDDVNANNDVAAINTLEAFISAVEAQRGKEISEADADELIAVAAEIIVILSSE